MKLTISGVTYEAAIRTSDVPTEESWPTPRMVRRGKGRQYVYEGLTEAMYGLIVSHLEQMYGSALGWGNDAEDVRDRAAIKRDLGRLRNQ